MSVRFVQSLTFAAALGAGVLFSNSSQAGYGWSGGCFIFSEYDYNDPIIVKGTGGKPDYRRYQKQTLVFFCLPY